jgi:hypothetical protein
VIDTSPDGVPGGIMMFTWKTPADKVGADPAYKTVADEEPIAAVIGAANGFDRGVDSTSAPSGREGEIDPSPVP